MLTDSLADGHEELKAAIPQQEQLGSDETSIKNEGKKHWVWCITAASFTLFHSEQQVRHCVIDRRITQGTRSEVGERYNERMWSVIATCNKQGRSFFEYLHASITAKLAAMPAPSLLFEQSP